MEDERPRPVRQRTNRSDAKHRGVARHQHDHRRPLGPPDRNAINFNAGLGVAVREYETDVGPADYVLFADRRAVGVVEAKPDRWGARLTTVEEQSEGYANAKLKWVSSNDALPFLYESTGQVTRFTNGREPNPRSREVFTFHRPETFKDWMLAPRSFRWASRSRSRPAASRSTRSPPSRSKTSRRGLMMGDRSEETVSSLAGRLSRLDNQLGTEDQARIEQEAGKPLSVIVRDLFDAIDADQVEADAIAAGHPEPDDSAMQAAREERIKRAANVFTGPLIELMDTIRRDHEQTIDHDNLDTLLRSEWGLARVCWSAMPKTSSQDHRPAHDSAASYRHLLRAGHQGERSVLR